MPKYIGIKYLEVFHISR